MNVRAIILALVATLWCGAACAQGFAGLGTDADGFAIPSRDHAITFPEDHGAHPEFRIEWWYVTATLEGPDGTPMGMQWTLFRSALAPEERDGWDSPQIWMAHAALTTAEAHYVAERLARGGTGQAGVRAEPFHAWIDEWEMTGPTLNNVALRAGGAGFSYDLALSASKPFVFQGDEGYSVKSREGQASYYYSQPFYEVTGTVTLPAGNVPVTGRAWLDREWSSQPLSETQTGWDWFSLFFDDGNRLMGFRLRDSAGAPFTSGTWIEADGMPTPFSDGVLIVTPLGEHQVAGRALPVRWRLELPERGVDVEIEALNPDAWMGTRFPYWEGPISIEGSHDGRGYLEMTGYD